MYAENDYRDYLEHSMKGSEWKNHKYLYKTSSGRYVYPEDVAKAPKKVKDKYEGYASSRDRANDRNNKYLNQVLNKASKQAIEKRSSSNSSGLLQEYYGSKSNKSRMLSDIKKPVKNAHGGGKSTVKKKTKYSYKWGKLVNPADYGILEVNHDEHKFGGSGRSLTAIGKMKNKVRSYSDTVKDKANGIIKFSPKTRVTTSYSGIKKKKSKNKKLANQALKLLGSTSSAGRIASKAFSGYGNSKSAKRDSVSFKQASRQNKRKS